MTGYEEGVVSDLSGRGSRSLLTPTSVVHCELSQRSMNHQAQMIYDIMIINNDESEG